MNATTRGPDNAFLRIDAVTKDFGEFRGRQSGQPGHRASGEIFALLGSSGCGKSDAAAHAGGLRDAHVRPHRARRRQDLAGLPPYERPHQHDVPVVCAVPAPDGLGQHRLRPAARQAAEGRSRRARRGRCCAWCSSASSPSASRTSSPAASSSAWRSRAASPSARSCCCSTSRSARWTASCARRRRSNWSTSSGRSA